MALESAIFTVLPRGFSQEDPGLLRATIFVSFRMSTDGAGERPLDDYPLFREWPQVVESLEPHLEFDTGEVVPAEPDPESERPDQAVFDQVFTDEVVVRDHEFTDLSESEWNSFPAATLASTVLSAYEAVGTASPEAKPPVTSGPLGALVSEIGHVGDSPRSDARRLRGLRDAEVGNDPGVSHHGHDHPGKHGRFVPPGLYSTPELAFTAANRFYDRYRGATRVRDEKADDTAAIAPPPTTPRVDLHAYLGALGDYPLLLRPLGIAIDVVAERPAGLTDRGRVRLVVANPVDAFMAAEGTRPWTHFLIDDRFFQPRPRRDVSHLRDGQLDFHTEQLFVHQLDIDGSVLKLIHAAGSMNRDRTRLEDSAAPERSMTVDEGSLPALRSAGLTVVHRDRIESVMEQVDDASYGQEDLANDIPRELFAEDVTRGYRFDVSRDGSEFRSLCRRRGRYTVRQPNGTEEKLHVEPDEGYVKGSSVTGVPGDDEVYLHEAIASWGGWSLVATRPGHPVTKDEELDTDDTPPEASGDVPLVTRFQPQEHSLTPLRYGGEYRVRGRTVDLAGNSVDEKVLDDLLPSDPQVYRRWEAVPHPVVLPHRDYGEGESQLRLVIRSTLDMTTAQWTSQPDITGLDDHDTAATAYLVDDSRWVVPPATSQQQAEYHGMFDAALAAGATQADRDEAYDLAVREKETLPEQPDRSGLATPYLPDVCSRGASFRGLPGTAAGAAEVRPWPAATPTSPPWHDRQPFRLQVVEGSAAPDWDATGRVLRVSLPQAELARVALSSAVDDADLAVHGVWDLIGTPAGATRAREGRVWMMTPDVEVSLVHAVEKPLAPPTVDVPQTGMERRPGESFVALTGAIGNHAKSTGRLDVDAEWSMQLDDLFDKEPFDGIDGRGLRSTTGHVGDFEIERTEDAASVGRTKELGHGMSPRHELRHELGDTRHRLVTYHAKATTRYREYFHPDLWERRDGAGVRLMEHVGPEVERHVPSSRRPDAPDVAYIVPTFHWEESVDSLRNVVLGGVRSPVGRPVRTTRRVRTCGLRVWLRRPWYSSGDGEMLAVVTRKQPWLTWSLDLERTTAFEVAASVRADADRVAEVLADRGLVTLRGRQTLSASERLALVTDVPDTLTEIGPLLGTLFPSVTVKPPPDLLTTWGADPAFRSADPAGGPYIHQFLLRNGVVRTGTLDEAPGAEVTAIGHTQQWDGGRGMWFCDIDIDAGSSYTPFVRLCLARLQPWSIPGTEISKVAVQDFVQLLPRRELAVTRTFPQIHVAVRGPVGSGRLSSASLSPDQLRRSHRVTVTIQRRPKGSTDDLLWQDARSPVEMTPNVSKGLPDVTWDGWLDKEPVPDTEERRILVREYEIHATDADADDPFSAVEQQDFEILFVLGTRPVRARLVYADSLPY